MSSARFFALILPALLLACVGCKSNSFVGKWKAVSADQVVEEDIFSADLILDKDGYALAHASERDREKDENGKSYDVEGETYAAQGKWEQKTDKRIDLVFEIRDEDREDKVMRIMCIGYLTGPDTMDVTIMSPERQFEAYVVGVEHVNAPAGTE